MHERGIICASQNMCFECWCRHTFSWVSWLFFLKAHRYLFSHLFNSWRHRVFEYWLLLLGMRVEFYIYSHLLYLEEIWNCYLLEFWSSSTKFSIQENKIDGFSDILVIKFVFYWSKGQLHCMLLCPNLCLSCFWKPRRSTCRELKFSSNTSWSAESILVSDWSLRNLKISKIASQVLHLMDQLGESWNFPYAGGFGVAQ